MIVTLSYNIYGSKASSVIRDNQLNAVKQEIIEKMVVECK